MPKTRDEFMASLKAYVGDRTDDESLSLLEDVDDMFKTAPEADGDTVATLEAKVAELEQQVIDKDNEWREKYKTRFFGDDTIKEPEPFENPAMYDKADTIGITDLFE